MNTTQPNRWRRLVATWIGTTLCCGFGLAAHLNAMIYRPEIGAMWDPSILRHNGQFRAFMMDNKAGANGLDARHCLLAVSTDGVHWHMEGVVNEEREWRSGNKLFKCFVGRCGDRFIRHKRPDNLVLSPLIGKER